VWEAKTDDGQTVALKFIDCRAHPASLVAGEVRVLRALSGLRHPHIVQFIGVHSWSRYLVLMMERADSNLADLRAAYQEQTGGNVPVDHALELLGQAAEALDFLSTARLPGFPSSRGLQHCDVKPSNLLLVGTRLKVADFGLCAGAGWQMLKKGWKGTIPYAAPELGNGGTAVPGTDQYALAVTFCEMVMGSRAFWNGRTKDSWSSGPPIDMTKLRESEFPVISRALHPMPSARWPSCQAFIAALRKASHVSRPSVRIFPRGSRGSLRTVKV
jgi:serine/threonine protein kinase